MAMAKQRGVLLYSIYTNSEVRIQYMEYIHARQPQPTQAPKTGPTPRSVHTTASSTHVAPAASRTPHGAGRRGGRGGRARERKRRGPG